MHDTCCYRSALGLDRAHCAECGGPLLRCAAFEECGGLVDADGLCDVCFAPALELVGPVEASVGDAHTLPLVLTNGATVARPLFLRALLVREGGGAWREVDTPWERLDAGTHAALPVAARFERAGSHRVEVALALASRWRWREEVFCFHAGLDVQVQGERAVTVQQNITYAGEGGTAGGTIYAPLRLEAAAPSVRTEAGRTPLALVRASRLERTLGLRGLGPDSDQPLVPRGARFAFEGFAEGEAPTRVAPLTNVDGMLHLGRARTRAAGGTTDVRLLARDARGAVDEPRSLTISRRHFALWIENDRLMVRAEALGGGRVSGDLLASGEARPLRSGDVLSALPGAPAGAALEFRFDADHGVTHTVHVRRV